jgi:hypothetical protein
MTVVTSVTMLFVRRKTSLSHHPDESDAKKDVGVATEVMKRFLGLVAETHQT